MFITTHSTSKIFITTKFDQIGIKICSNERERERDRERLARFTFVIPKKLRKQRGLGRGEMRVISINNVFKTLLIEIKI